MSTHVSTSTHVIMVSKQAAAALLPALDPKLKPARAVLLVTQPMQKPSQHLQHVLREAGIKVETHTIPDEHDFSALQSRLVDLVSVIGEGNQIWLNATGGTKLMALAAQAVADIAKWDVFYVDAANDQVTWVPMARAEPRLPTRLTEQLRLPHYLRGYGFKLSNAPSLEPNPRLDEIIQTLLLQSATYELGIGALNALCARMAASGQRSAELTDKEADSKGLERLLTLYADKGLLEYEDGRRVTFVDEETRDFAMGGWLERHVYNVLSSRKADLGIRDHAVNVEVKDVEWSQTNELDVLFLAKNRLHVIECKTSKMLDDGADRAQEALYKLAENAQRIGGIEARKLFVSYRSLREAERRLAKALGIETVEGKDLNRLGERLKAWIG